MADAKKPAGKPVKKGKSYSIGKLFEVKGSSVSRKNKSCPKCGQGFFLAKHKDRLVCGKCGYLEVVKA